MVVSPPRRPGKGASVGWLMELQIVECPLVPPVTMVAVDPSSSSRAFGRFRVSSDGRRNGWRETNLDVLELATDPPPVGVVNLSVRKAYRPHSSSAKDVKYACRTLGSRLDRPSLKPCPRNPVERSTRHAQPHALSCICACRPGSQQGHHRPGASDPFRTALRAADVAGGLNGRRTQLGALGFVYYCPLIDETDPPESD